MKLWKEMQHDERVEALNRAKAKDGRLRDLAAQYGTSHGIISEFSRTYARHSMSGRRVEVRKMSKRMPVLDRARQPVADAPGLHLMFTRDGDCRCRWPLWATGPRPTVPEMLFCGAPTPGADRTYCETHAERSRAAGKVDQP